MKPLQFLACTLTLAFATAVYADETATQIQQLITEGQNAYTKGDFAGAKSAFEMVYSMDSRNTTAIKFLVRLKAEMGTGKTASVPIERQMASIVIPQIQFHEATLSSALDYLRNAVKRQSNNKLAVNFVVQLPADQVNTQTVTLNLTNVPFTEAVKYLCEVANLTYEYDKYAIKLKPKTDGTTTTGATTVPGAATTPPATNTLPGAQ
ncbi:MAG: hypothetical protein ABJF10_00280 [Chthoniobacter sp.]|uniref:hypothetical protein n=1 Tax=Chthoniobacter sp. TaxID=2510640 RepID=UPI0032A3665D